MKPNYKQLMSEIGEVMDKLSRYNFFTKPYYFGYFIHINYNLTIEFSHSKCVISDYRSDECQYYTFEYTSGWQQRLFDKLKQLGVSDE